MGWRWLYSLILTLLAPFIMLRLIGRGWQNPAYWHRWSERWGWVPRNPQPVLWIHAVSVGEVQAAVPLINYCLNHHPHWPLLITTTTPTGSQQLLKQFANRVQHYYLPYDLPWVMRYFIRQVNPRLLIIMETELWPNLYFQCYRQHIPLILANARLSPRSCRGYRRIKALIAPTLQTITTLAAQSPADASRFLELGANPERLQVIGNLKFDLSIDPEHIRQGQQLRQCLGASRPIWIAASTHEAEETLALETLQQLKQYYPDCALIIAPRHAERFDQVWQLCQRWPYQVVRRSQQMPDITTDVYLADTLGELMLLYAAADIAFVGGSFQTIGGHNPLEPAALSRPIISGPHIFNFQTVYQLLVDANAVCLLQQANQLVPQLVELWQNPQRQQQLGQNAQQVVIAHRGALNRLSDLILPHL